MFEHIYLVTFFRLVNGKFQKFAKYCDGYYNAQFFANGKLCVKIKRMD